VPSHSKFLHDEFALGLRVGSRKLTPRPSRPILDYAMRMLNVRVQGLSTFAHFPELLETCHGGAREVMSSALEVWSSRSLEVAAKLVCIPDTMDGHNCYFGAYSPGLFGVS
jgi:hypothetical protein